MERLRAKPAPPQSAPASSVGQETVEGIGNSNQPLASIESVKDEVRSEWIAFIDKSIVSSTELASLELQPRQPLLGDWFKEGDLGIIYAFRGVGKTWFALLIAKALSQKTKVWPWEAHAHTKVLYVDGEMPADLMRDRDRGLGHNAGDIEFLNHEILFDRTGQVLNITQPEIQQAITDRCIRDGGQSGRA